MNDRSIRSHSPDQTREAAARLLDAAAGGPLVLALHGPLGSGKTCFVQGLAAALGVRRPVTSPTFTIVNEYHGDRLLAHIDLYRIAGPDEALALGIDEYLDSDIVTAIEWPERIENLLPPGTLHIHFEPGHAPTDRILRHYYL